MRPPVIEVRGLRKTYGHGDAAVRALGGPPDVVDGRAPGVDLVVEQGDMVAVMGSSGSGKSTLMNILGCLDVPTAGRYLLDGLDVGGMDERQLSLVRNRKIGFVFQGFNLLARTSAIENVELPLLYDRSGVRRDTHALAVAALERVGLGDRLAHEPSELSGGQQQRVAIARALVTEPAMLLADEPTGNLDTRTSVEILAIFQELNERGITILLVTHEADVARYTHRVIELRDGLVMRDEPVAGRADAASDLARMPAGQATR